MPRYNPIFQDIPGRDPFYAKFNPANYTNRVPEAASYTDPYSNPFAEIDAMGTDEDVDASQVAAVMDPNLPSSKASMESKASSMGLQFDDRGYYGLTPAQIADAKYAGLEEEGLAIARGAMSGTWQGMGLGIIGSIEAESKTRRALIEHSSNRNLANVKADMDFQQAKENIEATRLLNEDRKDSLEDKRIEEKASKDFWDSHKGELEAIVAKVEKDYEVALADPNIPDIDPNVPILAKRALGAIEVSAQKGDWKDVDTLAAVIDSAGRFQQKEAYTIWNEREAAVRLGTNKLVTDQAYNDSFFKQYGLDPNDTTGTKWKMGADGKATLVSKEDLLNAQAARRAVDARANASYANAEKYDEQAALARAKLQAASTGDIKPFIGPGKEAAEHAARYNALKSNPDAAGGLMPVDQLKYQESTEYIEGLKQQYPNVKFTLPSGEVRPELLEPKSAASFLMELDRGKLLRMQIESLRDKAGGRFASETWTTETLALTANGLDATGKAIIDAAIKDPEDEKKLGAAVTTLVTAMRSAPELLTTGEYQHLDRPIGGITPIEVSIKYWLDRIRFGKAATEKSPLEIDPRPAASRK